ncbi:MAG: transglycosylase domain-containing protein, partial [Parvularculaceae bacterium]
MRRWLVIAVAASAQTGNAARRKFWITALAGMGALLGVALIADRLFPPPLERASQFSPLVLDRDGRWVHAFATPEGRWRFAADLDAVDPVFMERLVAIEDKRFWRHPGVDPFAVARAAQSALGAGRFVSGASTITMQAARLLEPRPRTLGSKLIEMIRALQIERRLSKREILELYLTLAPYGGNIEGVRAASLVYFGKEPERLTDAEQALLIALPQAPEARRPDRRPAA